MSDQYLNVTATGNDYNPDEFQWYDSLVGSFYREDSVNGTSVADSMGDVTIKFEVPEGHVATVNASLTVDDWGQLDIISYGSSGTGCLHLGMMEGIDGEAGPRGGHAAWTKNSSALLLPGKYLITVYQQNATYTGEYADKSVYNVSLCNFSITASKMAASCIIDWPQSSVSLGNPITWYELRRDSNAVNHQYNTETISSVTAEEFAEMARVIYAEAGTTGEEMKAIASVMLNRLGNSSGGVPYRNPVLSMITEFNQRNDKGQNSNWASVTDKQYAGVQGNNYLNVDNMSCDKLKVAVTALLSELSSGPSYPYDSFRKKGDAKQPHVTIGGSDFLTSKTYATCTGKPDGWDNMPVWPGSPLDS